MVGRTTSAGLLALPARGGVGGAWWVLWHLLPRALLVVVVVVGGITNRGDTASWATGATSAGTVARAGHRRLQREDGQRAVVGDGTVGFLRIPRQVADLSLYPHLVGGTCGGGSVSKWMGGPASARGEKMGQAPRSRLRPGSNCHMWTTPSLPAVSSWLDLLGYGDHESAFTGPECAFNCAATVSGTLSQISLLYESVAETEEPPYLMSTMTGV